MHQLGRTVASGSVIALCAAAAVAMGTGTAAASTPSPPRVTASSSHQLSSIDEDWDESGWDEPGWADYCDDWGHRIDPHCHADRWSWDEPHHRWWHDRWDGHIWAHRGWWTPGS